MELEIVTKRENPHLKRTEVRFRVTHPNEMTPGRALLREALAKVLQATRDIVVVDFSRSEFGRSASFGYAKVYKSKEDAEKVERKHILVRNGLREAEKKVEKVKAPKPTPPPRKDAAPKPAAEKPAAPSKEEKPAGKDEKKGEKPEGKPAGEKKDAKPASEKKEEKKPEAKKGGKEGK
jgi:small subunit ribosomal protein S24e